MRRTLGSICVGFACVTGALGGCAAPTPGAEPATHTGVAGSRLAERPAASGAGNAGGERPIAASAVPEVSDVIATVGTQKITKDELLAPMLEEHGLNFLLHLVQLDLARQAAAQQGVTVTADDVKEERKLTFDRMLADTHAQLRQQLDDAVAKKDNAAAERIKAQMEIDPEAALDAYLAQQYTVTRQYVSKGEFNIVLETNAYLRKIAEASPELQKMVNEQTVRKAFGAQFGEKVVIRHIQANNLQAITEARQRLEAGESFADVARDLSTNSNTAPNGGAVPPFTMAATNVPPVLKNAAFDLGKGEVSETIQADNAFHILMLENRIAPKVVKFEDVKEQVRAGLMDQVLQAGVKQLRDKVARQALANMRIEHPVLRQQFEKRMEERRAQSQQQLDQQMKRDRALNAPREGDEPGATERNGATQPAPADDGGEPEQSAPAGPGEPEESAAPAGPRAKRKAAPPAQAPPPAAPAEDDEPAPADDNK